MEGRPSGRPTRPVCPSTSLRPRAASRGRPAAPEVVAVTTPVSVAHRINGERLVLLGWPRAILLQLAHPLIAAGVAEHSSFRARPLAAAERLSETVRAMLRLTFGTAAEREATIARIRGIHRRVHGLLREPVGVFPAGTHYSAEDPALVLWVHLTVIESTIVAHEALVGPVARVERDNYCADAVWVANALGASPAEVPGTWDELVRAVDRMLTSEVLVVGPEARMVAGAVLGGALPRVAAPAAWVVQQLTTGWLPNSMRRQYALNWTPASAKRLARIEAGFRRTRSILPSRVARWA